MTKNLLINFLIGLQDLIAKADKQDPGENPVIFQKFSGFLQGDLGGPLQREAVGPGADGGKGDRLNLQLLRNAETVLVTTRQKLFFMIAAAGFLVRNLRMLSALSISVKLVFPGCFPDWSMAVSSIRLTKPMPGSINVHSPRTRFPLTNS